MEYKASTPLYITHTKKSSQHHNLLHGNTQLQKTYYRKLSMGIVCALCIFIYLILWMVVAWLLMPAAVVVEPHCHLHTPSSRSAARDKYRKEVGLLVSHARHQRALWRQVFRSLNVMVVTESERARLFDLIIIIIITAGIVGFLLYCSNDTDTVQF